MFRPVAAGTHQSPHVQGAPVLEEDAFEAAHRHENPTEITGKIQPADGGGGGALSAHKPDFPDPC